MSVASSLLATEVTGQFDGRNLVLDKKARKDIARLITEADLMGLIRIGCPRDEYDPEIVAIIEKLTEWGLPAYGKPWCYQTVYDVVVDDVFSYYFGEAWRNVSCHEIAKLATSICSRLGIAN